MQIGLGTRRRFFVGDPRRRDDNPISPALSYFSKGRQGRDFNKDFLSLCT